MKILKSFLVFASAFLLASASLFAAPQNQFANIPVSSVVVL